MASWLTERVSAVRPTVGPRPVATWGQLTSSWCSPRTLACGALEDKLTNTYTKHAQIYPGHVQIMRTICPTHYRLVCNVPKTSTTHCRNITTNYIFQFEFSFCMYEVCLAPVGFSPKLTLQTPRFESDFILQAFQISVFPSALKQDAVF